MKKKKIGIITIHFPYNYGAMLQAYALQHYLILKNIDCEIIDFRPKNIDKVYHLYFNDFFDKPVTFLKYLLKKSSRYSSFEKFLKKYLVKSKRYKRIEDIKDVYDCYLLGSDQVFNPNIVGEAIDYYDISFINNNRRKVAFSPSFGVSEIADSTFLNKIKSSLSDFDKLSVREVEGVDILRRLNINSIKTCDPTFLLTRVEWEKIISSINIGPKKFDYILVYCLDKKSDIFNYVEILSKKIGCKPFYIHPLKNINDLNSEMPFKIRSLGPLEFLALIREARVVCSDSFHATVFSILFKKDFVPFFFKGTASRVENLLREYEIPMIDLEQKIYRANDISYRKIEKEISTSKEYLEALKQYE